MRKRSLHQPNGQDQRFNQSKDEYSATYSSEPSADRDHSPSKSHLHHTTPVHNAISSPLVPISSLLRPTSSTVTASGYNINGDHDCNKIGLNPSSHSLRSSRQLPYSFSNEIPSPTLLSSKGMCRHECQLLECIRAKVEKWNNHAMRKSPRYKFAFYKAKPHLYKCWKLLGTFTRMLLSIKLLLLCYIVVYTSIDVYFVKMPMWEYEEVWMKWELVMQDSVANLIPPPLLLNASHTSHIGDYWSSNSEQLEQFPYLKQNMRNVQHSTVGERGAWGIGEASEYVVPIPDYELMGITRGKLAQKLRQHAIESCQHYNAQDYRQHQNPKHLFPVMGITVATDTPENRYLRRILHTIDLKTVGSIVVTWYDEQTEAQLVGQQNMGLSHEVVMEALEEFIIRRGFAEITWREGLDDTRTNMESTLHLADATSLKLIAQIATSIQQFCIFDEDQSEGRSCRNELIILRFSTNLGCSSGVNNPLFTHPTAPHWLIANYDIAYPPGVLDAMGKELQKSRSQKPQLAVHTYGYIYGRGKLENPWSNFVMTSCAVANVGVWDENIFPAYYEDDDYRDRIRYILGEWNDVIGDPDRYKDAPQKIMNDTHLIHYQTDINVSVAHGPLSASTYLSGTHETMQKVQDEEKAKNIFESLLLWMLAKTKKSESPFQYESHRWSIAKEVSNAEGFFRCKHGALPDAGKHGEDPMRYFGWHERFILPFVNSTRVTRLRESMPQLNGMDGRPIEKVNQRETLDINYYPNNLTTWAAWNFNATRKKCVHEATNALVSMAPSMERTNLTQFFKALCSVC